MIPIFKGTIREELYFEAPNACPALRKNGTAEVDQVTWLAEPKCVACVERIDCFAITAYIQNG
jgi:hypothetical protein